LITVRCYDSLEQAADLREDVDALNRQSGRPDPFSTFSYLETYLRHDETHPAGQGLRLWFLAAFRDERLIGYVALKQVAQRVMGLPSSTLGFLVTHDTDRPHVVARPADEAAVSEAIYRHVLARRSEWSYLEFAQQDIRSSLFPPPPGVDLAGYLVRQWPSLENCTIPVRWDSLAGYVDAMAKKFRSNLGRQLNGLFGAGEVELLASADPCDTPALLELYLGIEPRSWKARASADIGRHPQRIAYFRSLLEPAQPMRVSIQLLLVDGVPVAGLISGAFLQGLYALHIVYDERFSRMAPGSAMLLLGMRQAIEGGHAFFNLLSGFGYFKVRWLAETTPLQIAQIYRRGSPLYWRRRIGDWRRRWLPAQVAGVRELFNPSRRAVGAAAPAAAGGTQAPPLDAAQRERIAQLVAAVRGGRGECLSKAQLAAVLPLGALRRAALASGGHGGHGGTAPMPP